MFVNQISLFLQRGARKSGRPQEWVCGRSRNASVRLVHGPQSSHLNMGRKKVLETRVAWYPSDIGKAFPSPFYAPAGDTDPKNFI